MAPGWPTSSPLVTFRPASVDTRPAHQGDAFRARARVCGSFFYGLTIGSIDGLSRPADEIPFDALVEGAPIDSAARFPDREPPATDWAAGITAAPLWARIGKTG